MSIPDEMKHPERRGLVIEVDHRGGLKHADINNAQNWAVVLQFLSDGKLSYGSGFFLNFPEVSDLLILTAAHNLISPTNQDSEQLRVYLADGTSLDILGSWVCPRYRGPREDVDDYGAILVQRDPKVPAKSGFGFNMKLGQLERLPGNIFVTGYRAQGQTQRTPTTSTGPFVACHDGLQIEYRVKTEQGISGSAVWLDYDGFPTVVAIHNHGPAYVGGGSRGSLLSPTLFREIFRWLDVGQYGKKLCVQDSRSNPQPGTEPPKAGLYLYFPDDWPFARVRLGFGTAFDVLPVQVAAGSDKVRYALAVGEKWVLFNLTTKLAVLSDKLMDPCLFTKDEKKKKKEMRIVLEHPTTKKAFQLRLEGDMISEFDGDDAESSEVSMVPHPQDNLDRFTTFAFV
ncbi:hypothetical protein SCP_0606780 [Sparassis crispa]|uniref:Serine protease n=1 Tax=Sparassis crispa TaxID=139825 RepID=A0A401GR37_9APHY|nr:hypothetical protein SCP_0606780 [Sparassis crispa]GBE84698.1 hypothetical protein SCP_0606780 [Sparassis crispa]